MAITIIMISGSNNLTHSTWRHIWLLDPLKTLFNSCTLPYRTHPCQIEHQWADNINRKNSTPGHSLFVYTCEKCKQKVLQLTTKVPKNKVGKKKIMIFVLVDRFYNNQDWWKVLTSHGKRMYCMYPKKVCNLENISN